jgi:integrase/recombinase XerD
MLENHVKSAAMRKRLYAGVAGDHVDDFADWLHHHGYRPSTIDEMLRLLAGWTDWMSARGFTANNLIAGFDAYEAALKTKQRLRNHRCINQNALAAAAVFIRFLRERAVLPQIEDPPSPSEVWPMLGDFRSWMRQHRGLAETTLDEYQRILINLIESLGHDPHAYTAEAVRTFVLKRAGPHGICRAKSIAVAVRALLRFLSATGQCSAGREHAIPGFANWQLSSVPKFLVAEDIERVIESCAGDSRVRDKAVILLLARLALRAGEVAQLRFVDIDWENGRLSISGKSRREEWLPLTQEVGDAILDYIKRSRPPLHVPELFITVIAPFHPIKRTAVTRIVRDALIRARIQSPFKGPHVLRHSAATAMLRQGVSLADIGTVLRHRSPAMTAHYAKVDFALLSEIAQPWLGRTPC